MQRAAHIHRQLTDKTLQTLTKSSLAPVELHADGDIRHRFFQQRRRNYPLSLRRQSQGDLGRRMYQALRQRLQQASAALIVGTDCPVLAPEQVLRALQALEGGQDAVLLPSVDGGYALLGLRRAEPLLFRNISWGSARVMQLTRQRLRRAGMSWLELPPVWDVDEASDYHRARRLGLL